MKKEFSYNGFTSRNYLYITLEVQEKLRKLKIAFFEADMSSIIAEHGVRLGLSHIHLSNSNKVELSNLNRQAFDFNDIGFYKVNVLKDKLIKINSLCKISVNKNYINEIEEKESASVHEMFDINLIRIYRKRDL